MYKKWVLINVFILDYAEKCVENTFFQFFAVLDSMDKQNYAL